MLFHMLEQYRLFCLKVLDSMVSVEDRQQLIRATGHQLTSFTLTTESALYWVKFNTKFSQRSLVLSTPTVGLGNFSGFLLCVVVWTDRDGVYGVGCTGTGV